MFCRELIDYPGDYDKCQKCSVKNQWIIQYIITYKHFFSDNKNRILLLNCRMGSDSENEIRKGRDSDKQTFSVLESRGYVWNLCL